MGILCGSLKWVPHWHKLQMGTLCGRLKWVHLLRGWLYHLQRSEVSASFAEVLDGYALLEISNGYIICGMLKWMYPLRGHLQCCAMGVPLLEASNGCTFCRWLKRVYPFCGGLK